MTAVLRRELGAYFHSPIGYIFLAAFYLFSGFYFFIGTLMLNSTDLSYVFGSLFTVVLFLIPVLTMRLFSEDRRHKTDQALLTAPVSLPGLVLGKFFSAVIVYLMGLLMTVVYGIIIAAFAQTDWVLLFGNLIALLLLGMALIAIGLYLSALTESQIVAAIGGFVVALLLLLIDGVRGVFQSPAIVNFIDAISFYDRYSLFTVGVFSFSGTVFFLSVCAVFLLLTVRVFQKRRWN